jgi:hypothetical protein
MKATKNLTMKSKNWILASLVLLGTLHSCDQLPGKTGPVARNKFPNPVLPVEKKLSCGIMQAEMSATLEPGLVPFSLEGQPDRKCYTISLPTAQMDSIAMALVSNNWQIGKSILNQWLAENSYDIVLDLRSEESGYETLHYVYEAPSRSVDVFVVYNRMESNRLDRYLELATHMSDLKQIKQATCFE